MGIGHNREYYLAEPPHRRVIMSGNRTIVSALERNWQMVISAVSDVNEPLLSSRPNEDSNSMSWLIWHMARVTDRLIHMRLKDVPQLWSADT